MIILGLLHISNPFAYKVVEINASDIRYIGILEQVKDDKEQVIPFTSKYWNLTQQNYSTIKKEILTIVLCISRFQSDLLN